MARIAVPDATTVLSTNRAIEAVILDMDGLMLDTETLYRSAWQEAARQFGADLSDAMYAELIGLGKVEAQAQVSRWFGPTFPVQAFSVRWERLWTDQIQSEVPTKCGLFELLDWIDVQRLPMAVATSTEADYAAMCLAKAGVSHRVSCLVTGDQVVARKPAPDLYLEAARRLAVPANACVAIEDSDKGIAAAHAAGMLPIMVPDLKAPSLESKRTAKVILASLHEVRAFLEQSIPLP